MLRSILWLHNRNCHFPKTVFTMTRIRKIKTRPITYLVFYCFSNHQTAFITLMKITNRDTNLKSCTGQFETWLQFQGMSIPFEYEYEYESTLMQMTPEPESLKSSHLGRTRGILAHFLLNRYFVTTQGYCLVFLTLLLKPRILSTEVLRH